jgi:flagellar biosynthetic protein FliR
LIPDLAALLTLSNSFITTAIVVFFRVGSIAIFLPALCERYIPTRIRLLVALIITSLISPMVAFPLNDYQDNFFNLVISEVLTGALFGISLRLLTQSLLIAGTIMAQSTSLSQLFGGALTEQPQPAMASVLYITGLTLLIVLDFHIYVISAILEFYDYFPVGILLDPLSVASWGTSLISKVFSLGMVLSSPFLIASLLYNVAMGVINKAMPQLMVAFVGAPAITAGGLVLLFITTPVVLPIWKLQFDIILSNPLGKPQ